MKKRILLLIYLVGSLLSFIISILWLTSCIVFRPTAKRAIRISIAYDQLANAAFGGSEDETISTRAGREKKNNTKWACILCKVLDWFAPGHCDKAKN